MPLTDLTDERLLRRVRHEADAVAFGVFYRRYADVVLAFFARRTSSPDVAADLMMEVFAAALQSAQVGRADLPESAVAWLFGIAHHKLADSVRQDQADSEARRRLGLEPMWLDDADLDRVNALTDESVIAGLLDGLPPGNRAAVWGFVVEDRTHADIGRELGCSDLVVRQRVSRGLRTLRQQLEAER